MSPSAVAGSFFACLVLALTVASVTVTLTRAKVSKPLRTFLDRQANPADQPGRPRRIWKFVAEAFGCPYCLSHWLAFGTIAVYRPVLVTCGVYIIDLLVSAMVVVTLSAWFMGLIFRALSAVPELTKPARPTKQPTPTP